MYDKAPVIRLPSWQTKRGLYIQRDPMTLELDFGLPNWS